MTLTIGYQVIGRKFGPTITIWKTKQQAEEYLKTLEEHLKTLEFFEDNWRIIEVIIKN